MAATMLTMGRVTRVSFMSARLLALVPWVASCSGWFATREPPAQPQPTVEAPAASEPAPRTVVVRDPELEQKLARSELLLLEKQAQVEDLRARLDDARQEVVRAMGRQQSQASRAEAASAMAEAEIALQSLTAAGAGPGAQEVGRLLQLANAEFERQNYAGAAYLAGQAKGAAFSARGQPDSPDRGPLRAGERPFASPLKLKTTTGANVREGPGGTFRILFTLPAGTSVTAHSLTDQWVRITDATGRAGWIHQGLIGPRP